MREDQSPFPRRDGVYMYQSGQDTTIMLEGHLTQLPLQQVRSIAPTMKGFGLVMIHLERVSKYTVYQYSLLGYRILSKWSGVHSRAGGYINTFFGSYGVANSGKVLAQRFIVENPYFSSLDMKLQYDV